MRTDLFLESALKLYTEISYWGFLEFKISLDKLDDVLFQDLPATMGYVTLDQITQSPIDHRLKFIKVMAYKNLKDERASLVIDLVKEISWAIGFSHIKPETIRQLMQQYGRI